MDTEALFKRVTGISFSALLEIDRSMDLLMICNCCRMKFAGRLS